MTRCYTTASGFTSQNTTVVGRCLLNCPLYGWQCIHALFTCRRTDKLNIIYWIIHAYDTVIKTRNQCSAKMSSFGQLNVSIQFTDVATNLRHVFVQAYTRVQLFLASLGWQPLRDECCRKICHLITDRNYTRWQKFRSERRMLSQEARPVYHRTARKTFVNEQSGRLS